MKKKYNYNYKQNLIKCKSYICALIISKLIKYNAHVCM